MRWQAWTLVAALFLAGGARAGLFDDDEARRQVSDLRDQIGANQKAAEERLSKLEAAVQDRKAILQLASLIEELRQEVARVRGQVEVMLNRAETIERRQKDLYVDLDTRMRKIEKLQTDLQEKVTQPEREAAQEKQAYEAALNQFKVGNYQAAIAALQTFIVTYPNSQLVPSAQYWVGNAYYALRDYKVAIAAQQKVVSSWPDNPKAPDALLNIASSQVELGDQKAARETLKVLVTKYPASPAAEQAKQRLGGRR